MGTRFRVMINGTRFGDHSFAGSEAVARVFLPLVDRSDPPKAIVWRTRENSAPVDFSGEVSWIDYFGWGEGDRSFETEWRSPMGRAPMATIDKVARLLTTLTETAQFWEFEPFRETSTPLYAPVLRSPISLQRFAAVSTDGPFPGSLYLADSVFVAAPAYADSIIVSGPSRLVEVGSALGLEIEAVSKVQTVPIMVW